MTRPKLLDLFCCAGGAAVGYHRAGFDVVGVDIKPQPHYPFPFILGDALDILARMIAGEKFLASDGNWYGLDDFAAIHASPPCQGFSDMRHMPNAKHHDDLIDPTRDLLIASHKPYDIENVEGAPLRDPLLLCGTMFGLETKTGNAELWRHRLFETSFTQPLTPTCAHRARPKVIGVYGGHGRDRRRVITVIGHTGGSSHRDGTQQFTIEQRREAMGIDWMTGAELSQAIPPAYTEFIGRQLLVAVA